MRTISLIILLLLSMPGMASATLEDRIEMLITAVEESECQFIRNGKTYTPAESVAHVSRKYKHFKDDIDSVDKFIELSATKSLMSGKAYQIKCGETAAQSSASWMKAKAIELHLYSNKWTAIN